MKRLAASMFGVFLVATAALAQTEPQTQTQTATHSHEMAMQTTTSDHDRMFVDMMTKHHKDGIRMAQMAVEKAASGDLRSMAQKMIDEQQRDIQEMQSLRGEGPAMSMDMMKDMPGMMPESQMQRDMARLESASGQAFDAAFTEIMPKHHEGAIMMAKHELQMGSSSGLKAVAQRIADAQTQERQQLLLMHQEMATPETMTSSQPEQRQRMKKE